MLLGAHVSIAGGFPSAPKAGKYIGCEAIQIFSRSPRMLRRTKPIPPGEVEAFWKGVETAGIRAGAIHGNYLINLAAPKARMRGVARTAFVEELERAHVLRVPYVIFHPGAPMGKGEAKGLAAIAEGLDWALAKADAPDVTPLLENTAGPGDGPRPPGPGARPGTHVGAAPRDHRVLEPRGSPRRVHRHGPHPHGGVRLPRAGPVRRDVAGDRRGPPPAAGAGVPPERLEGGRRDARGPPRAHRPGRNRKGTVPVARERPEGRGRAGAPRGPTRRPRVQRA